jgi:hypothetical protein
MRKAFIASWLIVLVTASIYASSVDDYRRRIGDAQKTVETMKGIVEGDATGPDYAAYLNSAEKEIKASIPDTEKVEVGSTTVDTANGWIKKSFDQLHETTSKSDRLKILASISERLSGINASLKELEAATASVRSKNDDKQKLGEILQREEYQKVVESEKSIFQRFLEWVVDWLREMFPSANIAPVDPSGFQPMSVLLQVLVYAVVIAAVGFLIYKFAPAIAERFRKKQREEKSSRVILGEHIDELTSAHDLFSEAESLARNGDLRGAIRKGYVALLCDLADRKVIGLARNKTNRDYLRDVRKRASIFERMKRATGSFERHWYGFRDPSTQDWEDFTEQYRAAVSEARQ